MKIGDYSPIILHFASSYSKQHMLRDVIEFLICPHCGADLALADGNVHCRNQHHFDVARQGYVNLLTGKERSLRGDTAQMVEARESFLRAGYYQRIAEAILTEARHAASEQPVACVADLGAGTGYYLTKVLEALGSPVGIALDISKYALRRAAHAHPRLGAVACDAWGTLPIRTAAVSLVLNVFAPRNGAQIQRILQPGGMLLVVSPNTDHLSELVQVLGLLDVDEHKRRRIDAKLNPYFEMVRSTACEFSMRLSRSDVETLVGMGPSAWHTHSDVIRDRVADLGDVAAVTASVTISVYRRR